jgi:MFS family permease
MLLVYALTRATQDGWASATTITLLAASAALAAAFVAIERRAESPLLPFHAFRGNTLGIANLITCIIAAVGFSQFFLLTLYLQQVLHYSAAQSGVAFAAIAITVAVMSNVAQRLVTRFGARPVLAVGMLSMGAGQALLVRLPVHGHYVTDLLPSFFLVGFGLAVSFVAVTIAALAGVQPANAGIASGLVNTSRQIGGALGLAVITTIATTYTTAPSATVSVAAGATHGYRVAFGVLTVLALVAVALTPTMRVRTHEVVEQAPDAFPAFEEAA